MNFLINTSGFVPIVKKYREFLNENFRSGYFDDGPLVATRGENFGKSNLVTTGGFVAMVATSEMHWGVSTGMAFSQRKLEGNE